MLAFRACDWFRGITIKKGPDTFNLCGGGVIKKGPDTFNSCGLGVCFFQHFFNAHICCHQVLSF